MASGTGEVNGGKGVDAPEPKSSTLALRLSYSVEIGLDILRERLRLGV